MLIFVILLVSLIFLFVSVEFDDIFYDWYWFNFSYEQNIFKIKVLDCLFWADLFVLIGSLGFMLWSFTITDNPNFVKTAMKTKTNSAKIVSLKNQNDTGGDFLLGSGSLEGKQYYIFYESTKEGITQKKISTDGVIIRYINTANTQPHFDEVTTQTYKEYKSKVLQNLTGTLLLLSNDESKKQIFYVPMGSIKQNYDLN